MGASSSRRLIVAGASAVAALLVPAALAFACVGIVAFTTTSGNTVEPGGTLEIFGGEFARGEPVDIRLDSPTGPVLATHENPLPSTMTSRFTLEVPIPDDITPGEHFLVATQNHQDMNAGIPARLAFYVGTTPPGEAAAADRPTTLVTSDSGPSFGTLALIALGVGAVGLLVAAGASAMSSSGKSPKSAKQTA